MAKMKVNDFVSKAIEVEKLPTLYKLGAFMNKKQGKYLLCDCSGLIKGILWGYPNNGKYGSNSVPDINADTMISKCSNVTTDMSKLQVGWLVWMKGHIGICVGNGVVVESSPIRENGIQKTYPKGCGVANKKGLHERKWTKCGKFDKYVDYTSTAPNPTPAPTTNYYKKYTGKSGRVDVVLEAVGVPSLYRGYWKKRKAVASANGISNYTGTASQNIKLINLAKQGKLKKV
ncbi:MAG: hypothetical protein ACLUVC_02055 [Longibaculum sp.]